MKLFLLLAPSLLAKTPHNREDVEKMSDQERKEFDRDILFDSDEDDSEWDPYELETGDIHERLGKVVEKIDANRLNNFLNISPVLNPVRFKDASQSFFFRKIGYVFSSKNIFQNF